MARDEFQRADAARRQRERRTRTLRMDFNPTAETMKAIEAMQRAGRAWIWKSRSDALNEIVAEWVKAGRSMSPEPPPKPRAPMWMDPRAARLGGYYDDKGKLRFPTARFVVVTPKPEAKPIARTICGGKRHRDGGVCQSKPEPGRTRCRFHGGRSTARGPVTEAGKARALANLRRGKVPGSGEGGPTPTA